VTTRTLTRFIPGEEIADVARWSFGSVDTEALERAAQAQEAHERFVYERDLARDAQVREQGYAEGFAQGRAHAILEEQHKFQQYLDQEAADKARRFTALLQSAERQLHEAEMLASQSVLDIALALARQVVRQELSVNPNVLQPVVREALGLLVADAKAAVVRMNPLDIEVFQDTLATEFSAVSLTLVADTAIAPGGCVVSSAGTVVDGRLQSRWHRALATLGVDQPWEEGPSHGDD
jgi:flagellar assembly protein FliH